MPKEVTSKNIDGITDLVVIAPIKEGFIKAYENVTHATRLKIVAEALNRIRVSAREHEFVAPFSDTTERILTLLDFRIGVIDKDLFGLDKDNRLQSKKYLYLTATFDGAWEPYMRLIWDPLGPFLDLLFCNCEGYVAAGDNSFSDYAAWVRANQMDSGIFYSTTGLTVKDHLYLSKLDRIQRQSDPMVGDLELARAIVPDPEADAQKVRIAALASATTVDPTPFLKMHELALSIRRNGFSRRQAWHRMHSQMRGDICCVLRRVCSKAGQSELCRQRRKRYTEILSLGSKQMPQKQSPGKDPSPTRPMMSMKFKAAY
jgi:hypothetical protein